MISRSQVLEQFFVDDPVLDQLQSRSQLTFVTDTGRLQWKNAPFAFNNDSVAELTVQKKKKTCVVIYYRKSQNLSPCLPAPILPGPISHTPLLEWYIYI